MRVTAAAWSGEAAALLERAVERHGGWAAWQALRCVSLAPRRLRGLVPSLKGYGRTFSLPARADVFPHEQRAVFHDYPTAGRRGTFTAGAVELVDEGGAVVEAHADARVRFRGLRKWRRWSPADALYFFGYALSHYHSLPFSLADGRPLAMPARALRRTRPDRRRRRAAGGAAHAQPPPVVLLRRGGAAAPSRLRRRHRGWMARGAHLWRDFVTAHGIEIARERHVVARLGRATTPFVALHAELRRL